MIELIAILAGIAVLILTPIEINKIKKGWMRRTSRARSRISWSPIARQLMILIVVGLVFGVFNIALGFVEERPGENYVKFFAGVLWFAEWRARAIGDARNSPTWAHAAGANS